MNHSDAGYEGSTLIGIKTTVYFRDFNPPPPTIHGRIFCSSMLGSSNTPPCSTSNYLDPARHAGLEVVVQLDTFTYTRHLCQRPSLCLWTVLSSMLVLSLIVCGSLRTLVDSSCFQVGQHVQRYMGDFRQQYHDSSGVAVLHAKTRL